MKKAWLGTTVSAALAITLAAGSGGAFAQIKVGVSSAKPIEGKTTENKTAEGKSPSKAA